MDKIKRIIFGATVGLVIVLSIVLVSDWVEPKNTIPAEFGNSDGFNNGYWRGINDMLVYSQEHNLFRTDTTITIHLEELIESNQKESEIYLNKLNNR